MTETNSKAQHALVECRQINRHIVLVTINRAEARNAISAAVTAELSSIVRAIENDDVVRAVILTGAGNKAFCSGADLKEVATGGLDALFTPDGGFGGFTQYDRRKPWIAAVNGAALAGGCELALACDITVSVDDAVFGLPEVTRGLIASAGGLYRLPRIIPARIATELIITGQSITAKAALSHGLVNRVVDRSELLETALEIAGKIAANAPLAVQASLRLSRRSAGLVDDEMYAFGNAEQTLLQNTADFEEGAIAFGEKRPPQWQGR